jgi:hypothetical protein
MKEERKKQNKKQRKGKMLRMAQKMVSRLKKVITLTKVREKVIMLTKVQEKVWRKRIKGQKL